MDERRSYLGLGGLERSAWRASGSPRPRLRLGAEIRGQPGSDSGRDRLAKRAQPDHERREGRQARAGASADAPGRADADAAAAARSARGAKSRRPAPPPKPEAAAEARAYRRRRQSPSRPRRRSPPPSDARRAADPAKGRETPARASEGAAGEAEHRDNGPKPKPTHPYDPNAIAKLIGQNKPPASSDRGRFARRRRLRACRTTMRRACRSRWPRRSTHG